MSYYEVSESEKQLTRIGAEMMDFSEEYGKIHGLKGVTDEGLRTLNNLSQVGHMLTHLGALYGTRVENFTDSDRKLIVDFMNKKVDIERK
jgi:hypothetical protein